MISSNNPNIQSSSANQFPDGNNIRFNLRYRIFANLFFSALIVLGVILTMKVFNTFGNPYDILNTGALESLAGTFFIALTWAVIFITSIAIIFNKIHDIKSITKPYEITPINPEETPFMPLICSLISGFALLPAYILFTINFFIQSVVLFIQFVDFLINKNGIFIVTNYLINDIGFIGMVSAMAVIWYVLLAIYNKKYLWLLNNKQIQNLKFYILYFFKNWRCL